MRLSAALLRTKAINIDGPSESGLKRVLSATDLTSPTAHREAETAKAHRG